MCCVIKFVGETQKERGGGEHLFFKKKGGGKPKSLSDCLLNTWP